MLNTFFSAAVCKISYFLSFCGPNFSFFLSFFPAHGHVCTHTYTHTHAHKSCFCQAVSADDHLCTSEEPSTAKMTQSQATQLPLFLCLEQKNIP